MKTEQQIRAKIEYLSQTKPKPVSYIGALEWVLSGDDKKTKIDRKPQQKFYSAVKKALSSIQQWNESYSKEVGDYYRNGATIEECVKYIGIGINNEVNFNEKT